MSGYVGIPTNTESKARKLIKGYVGVNTNYTPLEYIESTGTQWIDTLLYPTANTKCVVDFQFTSLPNTSQIVIGAWQASAGMLFGINYANPNKNFKFAFGTSAWAGDTLTADTNRHMLYMNDENGDGRLDETVLASHSDVVSLANNSYSLSIFKCQGSISYPASMKLYSCKIYEGEELVRDYIPVLDYKDIPCLYDKVEEKFYYNEGTGDFKYIPFNTDSYEPIEYIQSNGSQSINLGINATSKTRIIMNFYLLSTATSQAFFSTSAGLQLRFIIGAQGKFAYSFNNNSTSWYDLNLIPVSNTKYSIEFVGSAKKLNINGTWYNINGNASIDSTDNLVILSTTQLRLYSVEVCQDGKATSRKLIPVKRKSDNEVCLYDLVSNQFFTNASSGSFTAGPNIGQNRPSPVSINIRARKLLKGFVGVKGKATLCYQVPHYKMLFDNGLIEDGPAFEYKYIKSTGDIKANTPTQQSTSVSDKLYVYCYQQSTSYNSTIGLVSSRAYDMSKYKAIFVKSKTGSYFLGGTVSALGVFREGLIDMRNGL